MSDTIEVHSPEGLDYFYDHIDSVEPRLQLFVKGISPKDTPDGKILPAKAWPLLKEAVAAYNTTDWSVA
jgi:hypothetical protein